MENKKIESYWIGIHDQPNENFVYNSDNSPIAWDNWSNRQPNDRGVNQNCGVVRNDRNGQWDDHQCDESRSFACVRDINLGKC